MARICPLFSSSKGNSTYLSGGGTSLLIDAGVSLRQLTAALDQHGVQPKQLHGILITHEHTDHICGLRTLLKKYPLPVYASAQTLGFLSREGHIPDGIQATALSGPTVIGGIAVTPFDTPHDAAHSLGFRFTLPDERTVAIATDLGYITETVRAHLTGCDLVLLESNYDAGMLARSAYPEMLKQRIRSKSGHLDNLDCAQECVRLIRCGTSRLILGHLSESNNLPNLAYSTTKALLDQAQMQENRDYLLRVAPARGSTEMTVF